LSDQFCEKHAKNIHPGTRRNRLGALVQTRPLLPAATRWVAPGPTAAPRPDHHQVKTIE